MNDLTHFVGLRGLPAVIRLAARALPSHLSIRSCNDGGEMPARIAILRQAALTLGCSADKNAHFLRQAVSFASRNGRSANPSLKDKLLKDGLLLTELRNPWASMNEVQTLPLTSNCRM